MGRLPPRQGLQEKAVGCKGDRKEEGSSPWPPYLHVFPCLRVLTALAGRPDPLGMYRSTSTGPSDARAGAQRLKRGPAPVLFLAPAVTHCLTLGKALGNVSSSASPPLLGGRLFILASAKCTQIAGEEVQRSIKPSW